MTFTRETKGDAEIINVTTPLCKLSVSLYGGQLLSWIPTGFDDILFLSPQSHYQKGTTIQGGVPICWPWFGAVKEPKHGFAKVNNWEVVVSEILPNGYAHINLCLKTPEQGQLKVELDIVAGDKLTQTLTTVNGPEPLDYSCAIHNFWNVGDVTKISVTGLEDATYKEYAENAKPHSESPLQIDGNIDRVYTGTEKQIVLTDPVLGRKITIDRTGSKTVIVWNCWEDAKDMDDMPDDGYLHYLCMESGNALSDTVQLGPNDVHTISYTTTVTKI